ncbi:MAG: polyhydroxyalkanoate depolymerase [Acidobacteria bacterium]|nr:polyhydroxyalkanoate depolymerase [Acidobacteriota bacterium]
MIPCADAGIPRYTAYRTTGAIDVDGRLDDAAWERAPRSSRYVDLVSGGPTIHDTRAALVWDAEQLYVGIWLEEPDVRGDLTERDDLIYNDNDAEIFIAGRDAYYEFEINALGTIYEVFFVWEEAYESGGFAQVPELRRDHEQVRAFNGVGLKNHPRGARIGSWAWDYPGISWGVDVDGTLNDATDRDRGWTVELAFPWAGMELLARADGRALPPEDGDTWQIDFSRFNQYREAPPAGDTGGWAWSPHHVWDSHVPECFPYIEFSTRDLSTVAPNRP